MALRPRHVLLAWSLALACSGPSATTETETGPASTSIAASTGAATDTADPTGGAAACRFPTFARAETWLKTTDDGNCDHVLADMFGGDCENFHWLGLLGDPWLVREDGVYRMWFTAGNRIGDSVWEAAITEASSADGILWNDPKDLNTDIVPVLRPGTPGLDEAGTETISVVKGPDGVYRMYYTGDRLAAPSAVHVIGLATSSDGKVWTKHPTPVLEATLPWEQSFDAGGFMVGGVLEPSVLVEGDTWRLWYTAFGHEGDAVAYARIGYAESADGVTWTKHPEPVFLGQGVDFDLAGVSHTHVIKDPTDGYHLFYVGIGLDEDLRLGHAWSADGLAWEPNPANPIIEGVAGEWDARLVGGPSALFVDGALRLYYMGTPEPDFSEPVHFAMTQGTCAGA